MTQKKQCLVLRDVNNFQIVQDTLNMQAGFFAPDFDDFLKILHVF